MVVNFHGYRTNLLIIHKPYHLASDFFKKIHTPPGTNPTRRDPLPKPELHHHFKYKKDSF